MEREMLTTDSQATGSPYIIAEMSNPDAIRECFHALHALRPDVGNPDDFLEQVLRMQVMHGYRLCAAKTRASLVVAVVGFRVLENLMHGRHVYVDDLVTLPEHRDKGVGTLLIEFVAMEAGERRCRKLLLDTGTDNVAGARFSIRNGFHVTAHRFTRVLE